MMTEAHRALIFMVAADDSRAFPFLHSLEQLKRRDDIYSWLIKNKITGTRFVEFMIERRGSLVAVHRDILKRIDGGTPGPRKSVV